MNNDMNNNPFGNNFKPNQGMNPTQGMNPGQTMVPNPSMNSNMGMNPNMGMVPNQGMNSSSGMNPNMGVAQVNQVNPFEGMNNEQLSQVNNNNVYMNNGNEFQSPVITPPQPINNQMVYQNQTPSPDGTSTPTGMPKPVAKKTILIVAIILIGITVLMFTTAHKVSECSGKIPGDDETKVVLRTTYWFNKVSSVELSMVVDVSNYPQSERDQIIKNFEGLAEENNKKAKFQEGDPIIKVSSNSREIAYTIKQNVGTNGKSYEEYHDNLEELESEFGLNCIG